MQRRALLTYSAFAAAACAGPLHAAAQEGSYALTAIGARPAGERLARIQASRHFRNGAFHNLTPVSEPVKDKRSGVLLKFLVDSSPERHPASRLPSVKTDLAGLSEGRMVWLGHSGFFLHAAGMRIAVDPALSSSSPFPFLFKPFAGADIYKPRDIPALDLLVLTHDHYDHLDAATMLLLKDRTQRVICPLGVGAHLESWGWDPSIITETDWGERVRLSRRKAVHCIPSQHFSGRTLERNLTLWAGYMLELEGFNLYVSGDGGDGRHFRQVACDWNRIDLALMEDGQYDPQWAGIHLMPSAWRASVDELQPKCVMPCHNSKFELARHRWTDPLETALASARELHVPICTPLIGAPIDLTDPTRANEAWWRTVV